MAIRVMLPRRIQEPFDSIRHGVRRNRPSDIEPFRNYVHGRSPIVYKEIEGDEYPGVASAEFFSIKVSRQPNGLSLFRRSPKSFQLRGGNLEGVPEHDDKMGFAENLWE